MELLLVGTGIAVFCISKIKQRLDKGSDAMLKTDIEVPDSLNFLFQERIEELRQKYEKDYAKLHDETFNSLTAEFFKKLAATMSFSTNSKSLVAEKFKQVCELTINFTKQYQEVYSSEFSEALEKLKNFFEAHQIFFEAFALLDLGDSQTDDVIKYTQITEAYRLLGNLVNNYWYVFSVDIRKDFEEVALAIQKKTGFGNQKDSWNELKQSWQELRQQLKLFGASIKTGEDLFTKYKKNVVYFISSTLKATAEDNELKEYTKGKVVENSIPKTQIDKGTSNINYDAYLEAIFFNAYEETRLLKEKGIYLNDYSLITPLAWIANKHPEITDRCNEALEEIANKQELELEEQKIDLETISKYEF
jgi:hypothetical protein